MEDLYFLQIIIDLLLWKDMQIKVYCLKMSILMKL